MFFDVYDAQCSFALPLQKLIFSVLSGVLRNHNPKKHAHRFAFIKSVGMGFTSRRFSICILQLSDLVGSRSKKLYRRTERLDQSIDKLIRGIDEFQIKERSLLLLLEHQGHAVKRKYMEIQVSMKN